MKIYTVSWLGIPGIDITAPNMAAAIEKLSRHQLDFLMDNLDRIEQLQRDLAAGILEPTFSVLTILDEEDDTPSPTNDQTTPPAIVVRLFPEVR